MTVTYDDVRQQLDWLCDAMIPGDPELGFPSARDVDVQGKLLPMALKTRADLAPGVLSILARLPAERPADPLALVKALSPDDRSLLGRFVAGAYLASEDVMNRLGYPGFQALHIEPDYDEIMEAVEPIISRGPCYRAVRPPL